MLWTTRRTRDRLRVKPPVRGIVILSGTKLVESPIRHRGVGPVVRQAANHAITRPAIRTIYIGIVMPSIQRIDKFPQAIVTHRQIRRDANRGLLFAVALANRKIHKARNSCRLDANFLNRRGLWWPRIHLIQERSKRFLLAFEVNGNSVLPVQHPALQAMRASESVHKRPETHSLNHAAYLDGVSPGHHFISRRQYSRDPAIRFESPYRLRQAEAPYKVHAQSAAISLAPRRPFPRRTP